MLPQTALFPGAKARIAQWPVLRHLDDISHRVDPARGIHVFKQDDILLLRYVTARPDTLETDLDLECRSLVFDRESGVLLSRSFHKFFNLGEREGLADLSVDDEIDLSLKVDGTMLCGFASPGRPDDIRFHTKGGLSEHAARGRALAPDAVIALTREAIAEGATPIFEWTDPQNRIVIPYERTEFRLLAIRDRTTGVYLPERAARLARRHGVAMPGSLGTISGMSGIAESLMRIAGHTDIEGVVMTWPDRHRVKAKTSDYLKRHGILSNIEHEKRVYQCWLAELGDDTSAALGGERGRALIDFLARIDSGIDAACRDIETEIAGVMHVTPAERAAHIRGAFQGVRQSMAFSMLKGHDGREAARRIAHGRMGSEEGRTSFKRDLGLPDWTIDIQALR